MTTTDNNAIVRAAANLPEQFDREKTELLKRTICKGSTDDELQLFIHICNRTGLDPFAKQVYAVKRWDRKASREVMTVQTGIDGYRVVAERTGKYAGNDDPIYDSEDGDHPNKATTTVYKMVAGQRVGFSASARWSEYVQTDKDGKTTKFWKQMPYLMLGKVSEALALRKAFPNELSGIYTADEMDQADNGIPNAPVAPKKKGLLDAVKGTQAEGLVNASREELGATIVNEESGEVIDVEASEPQSEPPLDYESACIKKGIDPDAADIILAGMKAKYAGMLKSNEDAFWRMVIAKVEAGHAEIRSFTETTTAAA